MTKGEAGLIADFQLESRPGNERIAMERVSAAISGLGLPARSVDRIKTAVAEATMNAMEHGNSYRPDAPVLIKVLNLSTHLSIRITDQGHGAPQSENRVPDIEAKLRGEEPPRGWGMFLIRSLVDDMRIMTGDSHHTVELVVNLPQNNLPTPPQAPAGN